MGNNEVTCIKVNCGSCHRKTTGIKHGYDKDGNAHKDECVFWQNTGVTCGLWYCTKCKQSTLYYEQV